MSTRPESPMKNGGPFPIRPMRDQHGSPGAVQDPEYSSGPAMQLGFAGPSPSGVLSPPGSPPATLIVPEALNETSPAESEIPVLVHGWVAGTVTVAVDVAAATWVTGPASVSSSAPVVLRAIHRRNDRLLIVTTPCRFSYLGRGNASSESRAKVTQQHRSHKSHGTGRSFSEASCETW